jgi:cysteine desulfuration protein SufE
MKSIKLVEKEIIKEFEELADIDSKYGYLFKIGNELPDMDEALKNDKNFVSGCQSDLWFYLSQDQGRLNLQVHSDSMVVKGIGALFVRLVEGRKPEEIKELSLEFLDELKIWKLASNRNNGLLSMLAYLHDRAEQLSQASQ